MNIPSAGAEFDSNAKCLKSYLICAAPRTGSTMLSHMLMDTNLAGQPFEFLHDKSIEAFFPRVGQPLRLNEYVDFLKRRRCSRNGVFGFKAQYEQLNARFPNESMQLGFIEHFDYFILLHRKDVLSQAISLHRAASTGVWHETVEMHPSTDQDVRDKFDADKIAEHIESIVWQLYSWRRLLHESGVNWLEVAYEDLAEDPTGALHQVMDHLDLNFKALRRAPAPKLRRQADEVSREWRERFISERPDRGGALRGAK